MEMDAFGFGDYKDYVPVTNPGEKKRLSLQMAMQYSPAAVEKEWYSWWEKSGYFMADASSTKPAFTIVLPPPNVTGAIHIGNALTAACQDTIARWRRMSGYNVCWVPGLDHAGLATEVAVEKKIMRDSKRTRHDIGREDFVKEVWKWKNDHGSTILNQERRLGVSLDWSRECFTMDEQRSKAVTEAFVRLYKDGLIYRDHRLVNWDCVLRMPISDTEVDYKDIKKRTLLKVPGYDSPVEFGVLTSFAYPLEGVSGEIVVSTTRVEMMLGDTGIAVHPEDNRYTHLHGKYAVHPFNGRRLPIVCDGTLVGPQFGKGAVKITPAHDPNDFESGKRHNLESINILTDEGLINSNGGSTFEGMPRFKARVAVVEALKKKGLYRGAQNYQMCLGFCSRTNDVVEPMIKPQWYVNCNGMAKQALDAVVDESCKKIEITPKQYTAEWEKWLENIRDWCISRQLWWGHRIPAWYVTLEDDHLKEFGVYADHWVVGRNEEEALSEANEIFGGKKFQMTQDPDVLDSWFSSGLFPLSMLGWPDNTADFGAFYPTSVLETGHDILFSWVPRMVMLGMQLGGDVPFRKVYFHPIIHDAHGRKMSTSLGNVIDPLEVINGVTLENLHKSLEEGNLDPNELVVARKGQLKEFPNGIAECGADALRFALVSSYTAQFDKINLDIKRVVGYRQWCNKLWNAIRFAMIKLGDNYVPPTSLNPNSLPFICKWILSVLNKAISKTVTALESHDFCDASAAVYSWWKLQLCDVFIEKIKSYFVGEDKFSEEQSAARDTLWICLDNGLRLLHPFMPYITEELWQRLPQVVGNCAKKDSIMISEYPSTVKEWTNEEIENEMLGRKLAFAGDAAVGDVIKSREPGISPLASSSSFEVVANEHFSTCIQQPKRSQNAEARLKSGQKPATEQAIDIEDFGFRIGTTNDFNLLMKLHKVNDNQYEMSFVDGSSKIIGQVSNVYHGHHSRVIHPNILTCEFPCEDGTRKCIHEGWVITLEQVLADKAFADMWVTFKASTIEFKEMKVWLLIVLRGVLKALICLLDQSFTLGKITTKDIVFLKSDTEYLHPKIIDCVILGRGRMIPDDKFSSLADMITVDFTKGRLSNVYTSPCIASFIRCLKGGATHRFHGILYGKRLEHKLLLHPLFFNYTQQSQYVTTIREQFREKNSMVKVSALDLKCILGNACVTKSSFPLRKNGSPPRITGEWKEGWKVLFNGETVPDVMTVQLRTHGKWYNAKHVSALVTFFRDTEVHVNDRREKDKTQSIITPRQFGQYMKFICPYLLPYLFEEFGSCQEEDKLL